MWEPQTMGNLRMNLVIFPYSPAAGKALNDGSLSIHKATLYHFPLHQVMMPSEGIQDLRPIPSIL